MLRHSPLTNGAGMAHPICAILILALRGKERRMRRAILLSLTAQERRKPATNGATQTLVQKRGDRSRAVPVWRLAEI